MAKFYDIDPKTCSIQELKGAIQGCKNKTDYFAALEQGCKRFINSIYGALGSKYYNCANKDIAESITLQGQDLIKFSVKCVNKFFREDWSDLPDVHMKIAEEMKKEYPDFDVERFLDLCKRPLQFGDTLQVYGDSCTGDTIISVCNRITPEHGLSIEDLFNESISTVVNLRGKEFVTPKHLAVRAFNGREIVHAYVSHIIRHKTDKQLFKITSLSGKVVTVTKDHSLVMIKDGVLSDVRPEDIEIGGNCYLIVMDDFKNSIKDPVVSVEPVGGTDGYVYDIEIDTFNPAMHNFFGNGILLHNTDSVSKDSIIRTEKHPDGITIEEFYNENIGNVGETTVMGHESVHTDDKVINWSESFGVYGGRVERIIRHNVSKPKWRLKTKSGKIVECTSDHSLVVFRDGDKIHIKPSDIISGDKILSVRRVSP